MHLSPAPPADADCMMSEGHEEEHIAPFGVSLLWHFDQGYLLVLDVPPTIKKPGKHVPEPLSKDYCNEKKKEKKRKDYAFWRQFNEKPSIILGCPGTIAMMYSWVCIFNMCMPLKLGLVTGSISPLWVHFRSLSS